MEASDIVQMIAEQLQDQDVQQKFFPTYLEHLDHTMEEMQVETFADEGIQDTDQGLTVYIGDRGFRITVEDF